ncbi:retrotransposon protein, putative, ty1-copia subclass, partial [Tanacetum coccineum]
LTPPKTPQLNGVAERRKKNLVRHGSIYDETRNTSNKLLGREAQDKLEAKSEKCLFVGYPEESFGYLFYKPKDNVVFVARRGMFFEREMISKEESRSKIDLEKIQESADEEPILNTDTQQEMVTPVEPNDISLPIRRTSGRVSKPPQLYYGFHIEEDKINDSTLSELYEPANYKEAMASLEAAKWKEAMKSEIQSMYDNQMDVKTAFLNEKLTEDVFMAQPKGNDILMLQSVKDWLGKCFAMKDLGDAAYILGIKIYRDRSKRLIGLSQDTKDLCPKTAEEVDRMSRNLGEGHWTVEKNILKYLKNTKDRFLVYGGEEELSVTGYYDASWQTDKDDNRSQSGWVFLLNGGAVTRESSKQDIVAYSTCEFEYIAACEASKEAIWMKNFIGDLGVVPTERPY